MAYLLWFDDSKKAPAEKIAAAIAAYRARFGAAPSVVLINEAETQDIASVLAGVEVRSAEYVRPSNYWVGMVEV